MINEKLTKEEFGYYSWELSRGSQKKIIVICDKCGKERISTKNAYHTFCRSCALKGRKLSEEHKRKAIEGRRGFNHSKEAKHRISESTKGNKNHNFGKHLSQETKQKLRESHRGEKHYMFGKHHSKETIQKMRDGRYKNRKNKHYGKSKPEVRFEEICVKYDLHFKYVGDYSLWIGPKKGKKLNPDFIEDNGKKVVVEIMGRYWHSPLINPKIRENAKLLYRESHFKKYGWKSIFIWDTDLEREDTEEFVLSLFKK